MMNIFNRPVLGSVDLVGFCDIGLIRDIAFNIFDIDDDGIDLCRFYFLRIFLNDLLLGLAAAKLT